MTFDEFLQKVSPKIGPKNAFDLGRDARLSALEKLITTKLNLDEKEVEAATEKEFEQLAENILRMPPLPLK